MKRLAARLALLLLAHGLLAPAGAAARPDCNADQLSPDAGDARPALAAYQAGVAALAQGQLAPAERALRRAFAAAGSAPAGLAEASLARLVETALAAGDRTTAWHRLRRLRAMPGTAERPAWLEALLLAADAATADQAEAPGALAAVAGCRSFGVAPVIAVRILFASGRAELDRAGTAQLARLAAAVRAAGITAAVVRGHTDANGSDAVNDALSLARARTVAAALAAAVPALAGQLRAEGRGERELLYTSAGNEQDRLNRRVELVLDPG